LKGRTNPPWGLDRLDVHGFDIWVFPKIGGVSPKMDGENNGNPIKNGMIWGNPLFSETSICAQMLHVWIIYLPYNR